MNLHPTAEPLLEAMRPGARVSELQGKARAAYRKGIRTLPAMLRSAARSAVACRPAFWPWARPTRAFTPA